MDRDAFQTELLLAFGRMVCFAVPRDHLGRTGAACRVGLGHLVRRTAADALAGQDGDRWDENRALCSVMGHGYPWATGRDCP